MMRQFLLLLVCIPVLATTPVYVQGDSGPSTDPNGTSGSNPMPSNSNPYTINFHKPTLGNNTLLVFVTESGNITNTISDTKGDTFSLIQSSYDTTETQILDIYCVVQGASGNNLQVTVTPSTTTDFMIVHAEEWGNLTCTVDGTATSNTGTTGTSVTSPAITTTTAGDLIIQAAYNSGAGTVSSWSVGSSPWHLYQADTVAGMAVQAQIQVSAGAITPTFTQSPSSRYLSVAAALKQGTSGTAPPAFTVLAVHHINNVGASATSQTFQCPIHGNMAFIAYASDAANTLNSLTDSASNTWLQIGSNVVQVGQGVVSHWYAKNIAATDNLAITASLSAGSGNGNTYFCYDITGAATSPLDTGYGTSGLASATGNQSTGGAGGPVTMFTATPTNSNELIFATASIAQDTATGVTASNALFITATMPTVPQPTVFDENNFWAVCNGNCPGSTTWIMKHNIQDFPGIGAWEAAGSAFIGASVASTGTEQSLTGVGR